MNKKNGKGIFQRLFAHKHSLKTDKAKSIHNKNKIEKDFDLDDQIIQGEDPSIWKNKNWEWKILPDGTVEIIEYLGTDIRIDFPAKLDNRIVTSIGERAMQKYVHFTFAMRKQNSLHSKCTCIIYAPIRINIPEGVTSIGNYAFGCPIFNSINLPDSIVSIGDGAFKGCGVLNNPLPKNTKTIGNDAFSCCFLHEKLILPEGVTSIGDQAFAYCYGLTEITIPGSVTSIGDSAFKTCSSEKAVVLMVESGSYAEQYAREHKLEYKYSK